MKANKINSLDSMRGIAAIFVVLYHISWQYSLRDDNIVRGGYLMVDFFFVLSGFVISLSYKDRIVDYIDFKFFIFKRIFRLYPLHFFVLFLFFLYEIIKLVIFYINPLYLSGNPFSGNNTAISLFLNLLLVQGWGVVDYLSWNQPSWSISVELFSYIFFALIVLFFRKKLIILSCSISLVSLFYILLNHNDLSFNIIDGVYRCLTGFFCGVLANNIYSYSILYKNKIIKLNYTLVSCIQIMLFFLFFLTIYFHKSFSFVDYLILPLSIFLMLFLPLNGLLNRLLSLRLFVFFGDISYSIYMTHLFLLTFFYSFIKLFFNFDVSNNIIMLGNTIGNIVTLFTLFFIVVLSYFTHKYIEIKFTNYLNNKFLN